MRRSNVVFACFLLPVVASAQIPVSRETRTAVANIIGDIMVNGQAYEYDRQLADEIGPRLTGSENYVRAVAWAQEHFNTLGLTEVHTESFKIPATWEPETPAVGRIVTPRIQNLHIYSFGWSPSTPDSGVKGNVVYLKHLTIAGIDAQKDALSGNIVLVDRASIPEHPGYGQPFQAVDHLRTVSPKAVLWVGGANGTQPTSTFTLNGSISPCPIAQVGLEDVLLIKRMLEHGPVTVEFSFKNRIRQNVEVDNVIAEIPGRDLPNEVVIVAAHLDSWHPATGAQDNGTGSAGVVEVARAVKSNGRAPRRTMRFILFGGEEQRKLGSNAYVRAHRAEMPSIDCVLISDTGDGRAKGWFLMGRDDEKEALKNIEPLLAGLGSNDTSPSLDYLWRSDHIGFDVLGVPTLMLWTDAEKYFKVLYHNASDSFDAVNRADLNQGIATTAATAYAIADSDQPFAAHETPAQVEDWLKKYNQWDEYRLFKDVLQ